MGDDLYKLLFGQNQNLMQGSNRIESSNFQGMPTDTTSIGSGLFSNFNIGDLGTLAGIGFGYENLKQGKDMLNFEKNLKAKQFANLEEDRAYNKEVRERARQLRF